MQVESITAQKGTVIRLRAWDTMLVGIVAIAISVLIMTLIVLADNLEPWRLIGSFAVLALAVVAGVILMFRTYYLRYLIIEPGSIRFPPRRVRFIFGPEIIPFDRVQGVWITPRNRGIIVAYYERDISSGLARRRLLYLRLSRDRLFVVQEGLNRIGISVSDMHTGMRF